MVRFIYLVHNLFMQNKIKTIPNKKPVLNVIFPYYLTSIILVIFDEPKINIGFFVNALKLGVLMLLANVI